MINIAAYNELVAKCNAKNITLVAVSKTKTPADILALYKMGQRDFGENYVQELVAKEQQLPKDIRWHFIGHLQTNKVKQITPFVHMVESVDSLKLIKEINKQAEKAGKIVNCLLQVHIAQEETKFGLDKEELNELIDQCKNEQLKNVAICGLMGMASFTGDMDKVRNEFKYLKSLHDLYTGLKRANFSMKTLSMGMTADYNIAIEEGSNMIRIGSLIFGERN